MPGLTIGDTIPNLELDSTQGRIRIHDFVGDGYAIIFSHPGIYEKRAQAQSRKKNPLRQSVLLRL
jgi:hypothetical protein